MLLSGDSRLNALRVFGHESESEGRMKLYLPGFEQ